jgi:hypothetical protein
MHHGAFTFFKHLVNMPITGQISQLADHVTYEWGIVSKHEFSVKFVPNKENIAQIYVTPEYQSVKGYH